MPGSVVAEAFTAVSQRAGTADRCAKQLWEQLRSRDAEAVASDLLECARHLLKMDGKDAPTERCCRFLGALAAALPPEAASSSDADATPPCSALLGALVSELASHLRALDKVVRFRACQLLANLLHALPPHAALPEEATEGLAEALGERTRDKVAAVRAQAARALGRLCVADEEGDYGEDPATQALLALLEEETVKDGRIAAVQALPLAPDTLPALLRLLRDPAAQVRRAVLCRVGDAPMQCLSMRQRALVLRHALAERDAAAQEAGAQLLLRWHEVDCKGDPLELARRLDVHTHPGEAAGALQALMRAGGLDAARTARRAAEAGGGLAAAAGAAAPLQPEAALLWRCVCERLHEDASSRGHAAAAAGGAAAAVVAAAAADLHEALEAALPASASDMVELVVAHARGGARSRFAATQLLRIAATCMDWGDAASRRAAQEALPELLCAPPGEAEPDGWDQQSGAERAGEDADDRTPPACTLPLAGDGGDGAYEAALAAWAGAVYLGPSEAAAGTVPLLAKVARAAGVLGARGGGEEGVPSSAEWVQCLTVATALLRQLPPLRALLAAGLSEALWRELWEGVCLAGVRNADPLVRAKALEAVALWAVLDAGAPVVAASGRLMRALLTQDPVAGVQLAAARGLVDLCTAFGAPRVEGLVGGGGGSGGGGGCRGGGDGGGGGDAEEEEVGRGVSSGDEAARAAALREAEGAPCVAVLLTGRLQAAVDAAAGARASKGVGARGARRGGAGAAAAAQEALTQLVEGMGEALARLLAGQQRWAAAAATATDGALRPGVGTAAAAPLPAGAEAAALELLLLLQVHPTGDACPRLRQVLGGFFPVWAGSGGGGGAARRGALAAAMVPAARGALALGGKRQLAPLVVRFVSELLADATPQPGEEGACDRVLVELTQRALVEAATVCEALRGEAQPSSRHKAVASALVKVGLVLTGRLDARQRAVVQVLLEGLREAGSRDPALACDIAAAQQRLDACEADGPLVRLEEEEVERLLRGLRATGEE